MGKRINYEYVKEYVEIQGYKLLSSEYISAKTKLMFICPNGHEFEMTWNGFQQGKRCPLCAIIKNAELKTKDAKKFKKEVKEMYPDGEYIVLGEYKKSDEKILMKHAICDYEYMVKPNSFLQGQQCPKCAGRTRTTETLKEEVKSITNGEYLFTGTYTKMIDKTTFYHTICGNTFEAAPNNFINMNQRCPICYGTLLKTHDKFIKEVKSLHGEKYKVISPYTNAKTKIKIRHIVCGFEWDILPNAFLRGQECPRCNGGVKNKSTEYFKKEVYELYGDEYEILGEYKGCNEEILIKHMPCNTIYNGTPSELLQNRGCPYCCNRAKTTEIFKKQVFDLVKDEYTVLGDYNGAKEKLLIRHEICKHEYLTTPSNFLTGHRCPKCKKSKGEKKIDIYLKDNNSNYISQYRIAECKIKKPLPFDFAIFDDKEKTKLLYLIEYDGEQHFRPIRFKNISEEKALENFKQVQISDDIKNDYCKNNNIKLIRIPYWDFDKISEILQEKINNLSNEKHIQLECASFN